MNQSYYDQSRANGWSDAEIRGMTSWDAPKGPEYGKMGNVFQLGVDAVPVSNLISSAASVASSVAVGVNKLLTVYGSPVDISAAQAEGGSRFNYVNTLGFTSDQIAAIPAGSIIVGGVNSGGGIAQDLSNKGIIRIAGTTSADTAAAFLNFVTMGLYNSPSSQTVQNSVVTGSPSLGTSSVSTSSGAVSGAGSLLSGLSFDSMITVFVGIAFISAIMGIFKRR